MMILTDEEEAALESDGVRVGVLFRLETDPILRLWLGIGDCLVGGSAHDASGAVYSGMGQLTNAPAVQQLINGVADRVTFFVAGVGVTQDILRIASSEADDVKNAPCSMGVVLFGRDWRQLGAPKWLFDGTADYVSLRQQAAEDGVVRSIELSVGSHMTGRRRRGYTYWTDRDQQSRFPGDRFCERTVLYSREIEKRWPVPT